MKEIYRLEARIREFVNSTRKQTYLLQDSATWHKLCSSLDLIGDTQMAIDAYPQVSSIRGEGASYLVIYGILQTLLLQQDAATHIADALEIKVKRPKPLNKIRVIRNSTAGHPAYQKENGLTKSSYITRMSVSPVSFELTTIYSGSNREYQMSHVVIPSLIKIQEDYLSEVLQKVISELARQEMEHREMHKKKKLVDLFPESMSYHLGKISEATYSQDVFPLGTANLIMVTKCLNNFKEELSIRNEWGIYDSIDYHYELVEHSLIRLNQYFGSNDNMNNKDAYVFASFLSSQIKVLREIAMELDEQYESTP